MPTGQPNCAQCQDNLFVRAERIISGRRVQNAYYCGRCGHEWRVESSPFFGDERRQGERRTMARLDIVGGLKKKVVAASLRTKPDRRTAR